MAATKKTASPANAGAKRKKNVTLSSPKRGQGDELSGLVDLPDLTKPLMILLGTAAAAFAAWKGYNWWQAYKKDAATSDLQQNPAAQKALAFYNAGHTGWGTEDEEEIIRVAGTLAPGEWTEVQKVYAQVYNRNLATDISGWLNSEEMARFNAALNKSNRNPVEVWQGQWKEIYAANIGATVYNRYPSPGNNTPISLYLVEGGKWVKKTTLSIKQAGLNMGVITGKNQVNDTNGKLLLNMAKVRLAKLPGFESYAGKEYYIATGYLMLTPAPALKGLGCAACGGRCAAMRGLGCSSCAMPMPVVQNNDSLSGIQIV